MPSNKPSRPVSIYRRNKPSVPTNLSSNQQNNQNQSEDSSDDDQLNQQPNSPNQSLLTTLLEDPSDPSKHHSAHHHHHTQTEVSNSNDPSLSRSIRVVPTSSSSGESSEDDDDDEESSEDDDDDDSSEQQVHLEPIYRPTFVSKFSALSLSLSPSLTRLTSENSIDQTPTRKDRISGNEPQQADSQTTKPVLDDYERGKNQEDEPARSLEEQELEQQRSERRSRAQRLVEETLRRELADMITNLAGQEVEEVFPDVDDTDGIDPEAEFESWRLRELRRLSRERDHLIQKQKEKEDLESRRLIPEEQRLKEDLERAQRSRESKPKIKQAFLQKYHHKGVFYTDSEVLKKIDSSLPTESTNRRMELLPAVMQVRDFGKMSRTKWTHLVKENKSLPGNSKVCFGCGDAGHLRKDCPRTSSSKDPIIRGPNHDDRQPGVEGSRSRRRRWSGDHDGDDDRRYGRGEGLRDDDHHKKRRSGSDTRYRDRTDSREDRFRPESDRSHGGGDRDRYRNKDRERDAERYRNKDREIDGERHRERIVTEIEDSSRYEQADTTSIDLRNEQKKFSHAENENEISNGNSNNNNSFKDLKMIW
ncbi:splicing factor, Prp19-binding domain-containing protein [Phakopsora pachyrhizi]|nr:splicing factor, Prp19-binding domain-containing protein [Phakopsora pachyrhizi]